MQYKVLRISGKRTIGLEQGERRTYSDPEMIKIIVEDTSALVALCKDIIKVKATFQNKNDRDHKDFVRLEDYKLALNNEVNTIEQEWNNANLGTQWGTYFSTASSFLENVRDTLHNINEIYDNISRKIDENDAFLVAKKIYP